MKMHTIKVRVDTLKVGDMLVVPNDNNPEGIIEIKEGLVDENILHIVTCHKLRIYTKFQTISRLLTPEEWRVWNAAYKLLENTSATSDQVVELIKHSCHTFQEDHR